MLGAIKICSYLINNEARQFLYNRFVQPHLRYLLFCWENVLKNLLEKLQRLQNKAIKAIYSLNYFTPSKKLYRIAKNTNIEHLKIIKQVKLIYVMKNKLIKTNTYLTQTKNYIYSCSLYMHIVNKKKSQDSPFYTRIQTFLNFFLTTNQILKFPFI